MNTEKRKRLEAKGWKIGSAKEFLGLTNAEEQLIAIKLELSRALMEARKSLSYTQKKAASVIGSSQSRIAKMEAGDRSVSLDLLVSALLSLGTTTKELSRAVKRSAVVRRETQHA